MSSLNNGKRPSARRGAIKKAHTEGASYAESLPHFSFLSTRYLNEAKAIRLASKELSELLTQLEIETGDPLC